MKISDLRELLKNKQVIEEINKHLWIESQKCGYSIGIERATDEWIRLYATGWMKYNMTDKYEKIMKKKDKKPAKASGAKITKKKEVTKKKVVARKKVVKKKVVKNKVVGKKTKK